MDSGTKGAKEAPDGAPLPPYSSNASSSEPIPDNEPPPYTSAAVPPQGALVPPENLILSGGAIHSGSAASTKRLYELSHDIGEIREFHTAVQLSRVDYRMRSTPHAGGPAPELIPSKKRIYSLARPPPITATSWLYYLEATSGGVGDVGLEPYSRFRSAGYRVWKTTRARGEGEMRPLGVMFVARARGQGRYDWREGSEEGRVLAYESFGPGFCQLQVVEGLERRWRDVLVASWCLRLWQEVIDEVPKAGLGHLLSSSRWESEWKIL